MVMPVLAILAKDFPDYSVLLVGIAIGGYGLTQAFLQIPMGMLSDRFGRKPIIAIGLVFFCIGSLVAANADSMAMLVVGRLLQGAGAIAGAIMALAGDVSRERERPKVMAIIGIAIGFSFYLALLIGPLIAEHFGLSGIFTITGVLAALCIPLVWWGVPNATNQAPSGDTLPVTADISRLFRDPQLFRLNVSVCLLHMLITLLFVQLPGMFVAAGEPLESHWALYLPILVISILGLSIMMAFNRKFAKKPLLITAVILLIGAFAGFSQVHSVLFLALFAVIFFSGFNYLEANLPAIVSSIAPAGKKGSAMGMYASFQFMGAFVGGMLSGIVNQYFAAQWVFFIAIALCFIWLLLLLSLQSEDGLKRYALQIQVSKARVAELSKLLNSLAGVKDITIVFEQQAAYLKVDANQFELRKAQELVQQHYL